jgi:hypothetical protein
VGLPGSAADRTSLNWSRPVAKLSRVVPGVPLQLAITLVNTNSSCAVLSGYALNSWH